MLQSAKHIKSARLWLAVAGICCWFSAGPSIAIGQDEKWALDVEVLMDPRPSARLQAQDWGRTFQQLNQSLRFRSPRAGEQPGMENITARGARTVRVTGLLKPDGRLQFAGKTFSNNDLTALREALEELERFGAGGPPSQSPTFGLTDKQYETVVGLLTAPVESPVPLRSPVTAADGIGLPPQFRLRFTEAARLHLSQLQPAASDIEADFANLSKGTALAISLAQFGLGFRPVADPKGGYLIEVDVGGEDDNLWPVGWKTREPIIRALPDMFKAVNVTLEETDLTALISVIADQMKIPHFYSSTALDDSGIDITRLVYDRKMDRISMARLMTVIGDRFQLGLDVRVAENGSFFLWVTTREEYLAFRSRFAHVLPGK